MLIDTDVLIWYLKGHPKAKTQIEELPEFYLSTVTYIELVQDMRNKHELLCLRRAIRLWNAHILYLTEEISAKAMFYVEHYYLSHSLQLADALIGATAFVNGMPLLSANLKHYQFLQDVTLLPFNPEN
jgi:predicted nucleic acid-binding protein